MRVLYRMFRSSGSWERLFRQAADFASEIPDDRLLSISHSCEGADGVVAVWYRGRPEACPRCGYDLTGNTSGRCPECGAAA